MILIIAEEEALQKPQNVNEIDDEDYKKSLRLQAKELEKQVQKEDDQTGIYQDEKQRVNYFWIVAKKELEDKQADFRNKEKREMQDLDEKHQIKIKVYKQRVKHLYFQNIDRLIEFKKEAEITLKNKDDEHRIDTRELKTDIRSLKVSEKEQQVRQEEYLRALEKAKNKKATVIRQENEHIANEIKMKYTHKMFLLRKDMEDKRNALISQIEEKKKKAIEDLIKKHKNNYARIKTYYNEITNTNMDIIKQAKEELAEERKAEQHIYKELIEHKKIHSKIHEPLKSTEEEVDYNNFKVLTSEFTKTNPHTF